jgi:hypothetical protein
MDRPLVKANMLPINTPARYVPFACGRYEIAPGLSKFGKDFGNGSADRQAFQIDRDFPRYRAVKLASRRNDFSGHVCEQRLNPNVRAAVVRFIAQRLKQEHPSLFARDQQERLVCHLTGEAIQLDDTTDLVSTVAKVHPPYHDALDALAGQIQEDLAIISTDASGSHWLSYLHLCFPNHWAAAGKIGRTFVQVHAPVAGIEPINLRADRHVKTMLSAEHGLVRFAWGIATDDLLNHHPELDTSTSARSFDPRHPHALVRVERQTLWGFSAVGAALFTIRTYFIDCAELKRANPPLRDALVSAIVSMSPQTLEYKGLLRWRDALLGWLRSD